MKSGSESTIKIYREKVNQYAALHGWEKIEEKSDISMLHVLQFNRRGIQIHFNLRTREMFTFMFHHKRKQETICTRRNLFLAEIEAVFRYPRKHTGKGKVISAKSITKTKQKHGTKNHK